MNKGILSTFMVALLILTFICSCISTSAITINNNDKSQNNDMTGTGTIKGTITNQNGRPIAFVRVYAAGSPKDDATKLGFTLTHLIKDGKGFYTMNVPVGRYLFIRAAKLPFYLGAWGGPIAVSEGETVTLDLSITYIGPKPKPVIVPDFQNIGNFKLFNMLFQILNIT
ncbi:hypothetical protein AYK24_06495 [Thermoplasmatales archaeon SG8-52-4]|nr:MAG: hypothetical protein AYK24_06495 [Thermoplasmatales archaeon SG8-52-4]